MITKCKNCGSEIIRRKSHAKFCSKKCAIKWHNDNNPKVRMGNKINSFLYGATKRTLGFLGGSGYCIICGDIFPFTLNTHHIIKGIDDTSISLCANHHYLVHRIGWDIALQINNNLLNECYENCHIDLGK